MKSTNNIHPGKILQEEFLIPLQITAYRLAKHASIPQTRISEIIKGNRRITAGHRFEVLHLLWQFAKILAWYSG